jgi:hypothetical protein
LTLTHSCFAFSVRRQVCTEIGACEVEQFEFVHEPLDYLQEHWDDKCYVCQAFAKDLEVGFALYTELLMDFSAD